MATTNTADSCPPQKSWEQLVARAQRLIDKGVHPEEAAWTTVMDATAVDDALLDELTATSPDPELYAYWEFESREAEKQSIVLGNLQKIMDIAQD